MDMIILDITILFVIVTGHLSGSSEKHCKHIFNLNTLVFFPHIFPDIIHSDILNSDMLFLCLCNISVTNAYGFVGNI